MEGMARAGFETVLVEMISVVGDFSYLVGDLGIFWVVVPFMKIGIIGWRAAILAIENTLVNYLLLE